jgi:hypothetical protein
MAQINRSGRYFDWCYLRSIGWTSRQAWVLLRVLAFGGTVAAAIREAERS